MSPKGISFKNISRACRIIYFMFGCRLSKLDLDRLNDTVLLPSLFQQPLAHKFDFPNVWFSGKESACQFRRCGIQEFDPRVSKIPWRRKWQPTSVFLPGKSHRQRSLAGYSPWGHKELDMTKHEAIILFSTVIHQ